jgi:predicted anti-sigma-YlaC factor YlaD
MAKEPTFLQGLLGSAIPLAVAIAVIMLATALVYTFWFGVDWISNWLF